MKLRTLCFGTALLSLSVAQAAEQPKNIIYMIGDGMGPAYTTAYRYFSDDPSTEQIESTVFDSMLVGMAYTYPDDHTLVTDSAASATALSSAVKTYNGAIAVDTNQENVETMLEMAKAKGMVTAVVATSHINHATPASFATHNVKRSNVNEIADDYIDNKVAGKLPVDLMLGGGTQYFIREDRNLVNEFIAAGYQYSDNLTQLNDLKTLPALGLYAAKGLPYAIDSKIDRLGLLTDKALELVDAQKKPFFMMIEGSQIDWCGHNNDIACAMGEMHDFAVAIEKAKAYVDSRDDTLLVITADHSTGGLTLGANGKYEWKHDVVKGITASASVIAERMMASTDLATIWQQTTAMTLNEEQIKRLDDAKKVDTKALEKEVKQMIDLASSTGWTTSGHTAIDVQVFAYGKGYEQFIGAQDNTEIASKLIKFVKNN